MFLWAAAADLAIDGVLGTVWFTLLVTLVSTGLGLVPLFGVGVLLLWATALAARGIRVVERRRAEAIYGVTITPAVPRRVSTTGFWGFIAQVFTDLFSAAFWKGFLHTVVTMVLGSLFWIVLQLALFAPVDLYRGRLDGVALSISGPLPLLLGVLGSILGLAVLVLYVIGAGLLDRRLAVLLLGTGRTAALEQRVDALQGARQGAVDAAALERQRIERDLHDGVQPQLVSIAMTLGLAQQKLDDDPDGARALLDEAHRATKQSITELRHLARGIHPAVLTDRGLDAALSAVASHCTVPTSVRVELPARPSAEVEAVVYFAVSEALTNVSKHSRATACSVSVTQTGAPLPAPAAPDAAPTAAIPAGTPCRIRAVVFDDGIGGAELGRGGGVGLTGLADRVRAAGGTVAVHSPAGGPTVLTVEVPCAF